jgi:hypothetical protein
VDPQDKQTSDIDQSAPSVIQVMKTAGDGFANKKMSRKEFLAFSGAGLLSIMGIGSIIEFLRGESKLTALQKQLAPKYSGVLTDVGDVTITNPTSGDVLTYDQKLKSWVNAYVAMTTLADTSISGPVSNQVLVYNATSGKWVNQFPRLGFNRDVNVTNPSDAEVLTYDAASASWTNKALPTAGVSSVNSQTGNVAITAAGIGALVAANDLSDLTNAGTARTNLGLGSAATHNTTDFDAAGAATAAQDASLQKSANLSDVASVSIARTNLGLGTAATQNTSAFLQPSNNLSDVSSAATSRTNLGLGTAATMNAGAANGVASLDGSGNVPANELGNVPANLRYRGAWQANTAYSVDDAIANNGGFYVCTSAHTSGSSFAGTDWTQLSAPNGTYVPAAYETEIGTVQAALPNLMAAIRNYDDHAAPTLRIIGLGSSVGLGPNGGLDNTNSTTAYLVSSLVPWLNRLGNQVWSSYNGSVAGSTINGGAYGDYATAKTNAGGVPNLVLLTYGMNEGTPGQYYAGLTLPGVYSSGASLIEEITADGADVIILGTPHLNTATYTYSWGGPFNYPDGTQTPLMSNAVVNIENVDGVTVPANYYHLRVNEQLRQLASDTGCLFLDVERYWLQAVANYGLSALFNSGQTVHPNLFGFQQSFFLAINDFITSIRRSTVRPGVVAGRRSGWRMTTVGASGISVSNGGTFTVTLPAGVSGRLLIGGSSGGGNQSVWEGTFVTTSSGSAVAAGANAHLGGSQVVASVAGSATGPTITVTVASTGAGSVVDWQAEYAGT